MSFTEVSILQVPFQQVVATTQTTQGRTNSGIEIKICGTVFLYSKEGWISTIGTRLLET